jgi:hypothetical protein
MLSFPFKFIIDIQANVSFHSNDDKKHATEKSPIQNSAIITQIEISINKLAAFTK